MSINFSMLNLTNNSVFGKRDTDKKLKDNVKGSNLTNGLSLEEFKKIDKNGDGKVTQKEFIENFNKKDREKAKKLYQEYYKLFTQQTKKKTAPAAQAAASTNKTTTAKKNTSTNKSENKSTTKTTTYKNGQTKTKTITNEDGSTTVIKYNKNGKKISKTKTTEEGTQTKVKYNNNKPSTKTVKDKDGHVTSKTEYNYKPNGKIKSKVTENKVNGSTTTTTYNNNEKPASTVVKDKQNNVVSKTGYTYKKDGTLDSKVKNNKVTGATTTYKYDKKGKIDNKTTIDKDGTKTVVNYGETTTNKSEKSRLVTITKDGKTYTEKQILDENNRVSSKEKYSGKVTQEDIASGKAGKPISTTQIQRDSSGKTTLSVEVLYKEDGSPKGIKVSSYNNGVVEKRELYSVNKDTASDINNLSTENYTKYLENLSKTYNYDDFGNYQKTEQAFILETYATPLLK